MSGFGALRELGVTVRPLMDPKPPQGGTYSPFSASLTSTVEILVTELRALDAQNVIVELDLRDRDIRLDGLPRSDARPSHDGVALTFESRFGPQRFVTAEFCARWGVPAWQANLRAIALGMQALRAVDRYGISRRGEQYRGFLALTASTDPADAVVTREQALEVIRRHVDGERLRTLPEEIRLAIKRTHPDAGGDETEFRTVMRAKEILER